MRVLGVHAHPDLLHTLAQEHGIHVDLACRTPYLEPARRLAGINRVYRFDPKTKLDFTAIHRLREAIEETRPDVIHAFWGKALAAAAIALRQVRGIRPKLISFRGIATQPSVWDPSDWITYLHPRVDAHSCESAACREGLVRVGIAPDRCHLIYNRPEWAHPGNGRADLTQFEIPTDGFVLGTIANMRRVKGADVLLEAVRQCHDLPDLYVILFGRVLDDRVVRLADDSTIRDRVRLAGFHPRARTLIKGADAFVMASRTEGLCVAILEAMMQAVCPIVSDAGGMKEVVRNGVDGIVFPSENPAALADAIRQLYANRQTVAAYARSAKLRCEQEFSVGRMADRTAVMYRQTLESSEDRSQGFVLKAVWNRLVQRAA